MTVAKTQRGTLTYALGRRDERLAKRTAAFNYFYNDAYSSVRALGGRSFASRAADRASVYSANNNLILWSYPLIRGSEWRKEELLALSKDKRVLFIKGENDWVSLFLFTSPGFNSLTSKFYFVLQNAGLVTGPRSRAATDMLTSNRKFQMASGLLMNTVRKQMKAQTWMINVKDMDHNMNFKTDLEEEKMCNVLGVIAGTWLERNNGTGWDAPIPWDSANSIEMDLEWNKDSQEAQWEVWDWPAACQQGLMVRVDSVDDTKLSFNLEA